MSSIRNDLRHGDLDEVFNILDATIPSADEVRAVLMNLVERIERLEKKP